MNILCLNPGPQAAAPPANARDPGAPQKRRRATGEQIRRLVREGSNRSDPITVAKGLVDNHPELVVSSFRWLVRQVAWALALEQLRDVGAHASTLNKTRRPRRRARPAAQRPTDLTDKTEIAPCLIAQALKIALPSFPIGWSSR